MHTCPVVSVPLESIPGVTRFVVMGHASACVLKPVRRGVDSLLHEQHGSPPCARRFSGMQAFKPLAGVGAGLGGRARCRRATLKQQLGQVLCQGETSSCVGITLRNRGFDRRCVRRASSCVRDYHPERQGVGALSGGPAGCVRGITLRDRGFDRRFNGTLQTAAVRGIEGRRNTEPGKQARLVWVSANARDSRSIVSAGHSELSGPNQVNLCTSTCHQCCTAVSEPAWSGGTE
jgi:hypothetical protein